MNYLDECLFEPRITWPKDEFNRRSYSRWAAGELLEIILDNPFKDSKDIIEGFIIQMLYFSYLANNEKASGIFIVAMDVAEDILMMLV